MRHHIAVPLLIAIFIAPAINQTPRKPATPPPPPQHAQWLPAAEQYFGLTEETFREAGLSKLTPEEYGVLLSAISDQQTKSAENAKKGLFTYDCGGFPEKNSKIKLTVDSNSDAPSELMSPLRQRIRGMPDVEIVFDPKQADFGVTVLPMPIYNVNHYKIGYGASVVTYTECQARFGDKTWPIKVLNNHWIFTAGTDVTQIVNDIVTSLDTGDIEGARKLHATVDKLSEPK
jgi:hypothetical protein